MDNFVVATLVAAGNPELSPQIDIWAVRTETKERAEGMIRHEITPGLLMAITVRNLNDSGANALGMPDDFARRM